MRRQYHLRKSERGLLAWDVHCLIDLAKTVNPQAIALIDIAELDENFSIEGQVLQNDMRAQLIGAVGLQDLTLLLDPARFSRRPNSHTHTLLFLSAKAKYIITVSNF